MLHIYLKYDQKFLTQLCHCAKESLEMFFQTMLDCDDGILDMIMVIQTFYHQAISYHLLTESSKQNRDVTVCGEGLPEEAVMGVELEAEEMQ
jgi:hypothetical protein